MLERNLSKTGPLMAILAIGGFVLAGCAGPSESAVEESPAPEQEAQTEAQSLVIGYSPKFLKDDFQVLLEGAVQNEASSRGWTVNTSDANGDVAKQVADIENLIAGGAQALVIVPVDGAGVVPGIEAANAAGIPVFSIDDGPAGGDVFATVRADNINAGVQGAEEMVNRLQNDSCWPSECVVLELQGGLQTVNGQHRSQGFYDTISELAPEVDVIQRPTEWTAEMAADATQNVLTQTPDLDGIFMASELMAAAVNARLAEAGRGAAVGDPESVIRVAIDGTPAGLQLIREGALDATVSQPLGAYASKVMELIELAISGGALEDGPQNDGQVVTSAAGKEYQLFPTLVTSSNVDDQTLWGNLAG
jgi:ribose transport system substrate-binding protein